MRCFELIEVFCVGYFLDFVLGWLVCLKKPKQNKKLKKPRTCVFTIALDKAGG